eukprot:CAMPEP_0114047496 /NCGR_PEP_ID=MMETSP1339-20121228/34439_1 /TAXON_ID=94617 /ORGANISM="Fibrocapsa japonica" /LENGTH=40 /assembly_acc=CAM_ASM_000762
MKHTRTISAVEHEKLFTKAMAPFYMCGLHAVAVPIMAKNN